MRLSLYYVLTYLTLSGVGLVVAPGLVQRLLFASVIYDAPPMRFAGLFILGLAAIVAQVIRRRIDGLYPTLVGVRVLFCTAYVALFVATHNPFFLSVLAVVGLGLIMSTVGLAIDHRG